VLSDDVKLLPASNAKRLLIELDPLKVFVSTRSHPESARTVLAIECSDERMSRELRLVLLQWVSRTSRKPSEGFPVAPKPRKKKEKRA